MGPIARFLLLSTTLMLLAACGGLPVQPYGFSVKDDHTTFRLYAPQADSVFVVIFATPEAARGTEYPMMAATDGDWLASIQGVGYGDYYGYRLAGSGGQYHQFDSSIIVADPYTIAGVSQNSDRHVAKSLIYQDDFDWAGDEGVAIDPRDAIIYEMHIRDLTMHASSGASQPGTYLGLVEPDQAGGIAHIKDLGFNAVELLPAMDFASFEAPYLDSLGPVYNTWNPYGRNHWGYMTTFFFAPEAYYATDGTDQPLAWNGVDGRAVSEFKSMVKAFHDEGIAVLMDVVYNHVSNYDYHPLKYIDKEAYFRLDAEGNYIAQSGCGNDTRTEHLPTREMILASVRYWMEEYHIDGFRFDLAQLIDKETCRQIIAEARRINPDVIIIAEPWGGGYDPSGFSDIGWASWNDQFRNGIKGQNPHDGLGFIFGQWQGSNDQSALRRFVSGSLRDDGGQYLDVAHSVNYLESHDDHTMGDFIRIGLEQVAEDAIIDDYDAYSRLDAKQLAVQKLAALTLLTSQGAVMIHEGQTWGRGKVIAPTNVPEQNAGHIDHNSYNKDNATNWLNWDHKQANSALVDYYRDLIALRKQLPALRHSDRDGIEFIDVGKQVAVAYYLGDSLAVLLNGDNANPLTITLRAGDWVTLADGAGVYPGGSTSVSGELAVPPTSGVVLGRR
ncbi:DUF3459 domain-containing protein [Candidatus Neomarinimicrobiota bacterium]